MKEKIINILYKMYNFYLIKILNKKNGNFKIPEQYEINFVENFTEYKSDLWLKRYDFGNISIAQSWQYFSEENVEFTNNGLNLHQTSKDRTIQYWDGKTYNTIIDTSCITSKKPFGYGLYEFDIQLPKGVGLWPAVWLSCFDSWPPEIDLMEAYSDINGKYNNRLNTNAYFGNVEAPKNVNANKSIPIKEKNIYNNINLKLIWNEDKIEYYYNNFKVRTITNKKVLSHFKDKKMTVILGTGVQEHLSTKIDKNQKSTFIVTNFTYYKNK